MARACSDHQGSILIIEKDVHTAYLLDYMLRREGYHVVSTTNSEIARQLLPKMAPADVIFLDIAYACQDGCTLLSTIRRHSDWQHVPVLLLAEHYTMEDVGLALDAGATDYIVQPFNHAELLTQIKRHAVKMHQA